MGKKILLILFLGFSSFICAQEWIVPRLEPIYPAHEFRFGIGVKPFEAAAVARNFMNFDMIEIENNFIEFDVPDYYRGTRYTTNALFGEYSYQANKWIGLGVTAVYFSYYSKYHDEQTDLQVGFNQISHLSVYPTLRYTWLKKPSYSLYSSFGMGLRTVIEYDDLRYNTTINGKIKLAAQFTLLGFTIGKDVFCFSDLSTVGTQGIITIGLGYRLQKAVQR